MARIIAEIIFLLRKWIIKQASARFVVCTGTSGKTTTRDVVAYSLKKMGYNVVSPHSGYTNELGIVLASLGLEHISLRTIAGWKKIFAAHPQSDFVACIELGADFRNDIRWFLKHYTPYIVCITDVDPAAWSRDPAELMEEKKLLLAAVPTEGLVIYASDNVVAKEVEATTTRGAKISIPASPADRVIAAESLTMPHQVQFEIGNTSTILTFPHHIFSPQHRALSFAIAAMHFLQQDAAVDEHFFSDYSFPDQRLNITRITDTIHCIADTYKAIPHCTNWFLSLAATIEAPKKVLVLSEMRPAPKNMQKQYTRIGTSLATFDAVYFVGPLETFNMLHTINPNVVFISSVTEYPIMAEKIYATLQSGGVLFLKGSYTYRLDDMCTAVIDLSKKK